MDKMQKLINDHPWSHLTTITTFDTGDENYISDFKNFDKKANGITKVIRTGNRNNHNLLKAKTTTPISLLVESLVQQLCSLLEPDNEKASKLYKTICEKLHEMKLIDESYSMEEFEILRCQYKKALYHLVSVAKGTEFTIPVQPPFSPPNSTYEWSRYHREFIELEFIAGGAFGRVFKAKHKLDGTIYAVKKIYIKSSNIKSIMSHLSEVQTFASLNHVNVVQYKAAWLESDINRNTQTIISDVCDTSSESEMTGTDSQTASVKTATKLDDLTKSNSSDGFTIEFEKSKSNSDESANDGEDTVDSNSSLNNNKICRYNVDEIDSIKCKKAHTEGATLYIQMALCQTTLKQWLEMRNQTEKKISFAVQQSKSKTRMENVVEIFRQLVKGLQYIHSKNIVHHDIKPSNVFISTEGGSISVQLGDFGLACPLQKPHEGVAQGTHLYAAPEQLLGKCDAKNDMYSLGIILLELIESFDTDMERVHQIAELRKGRLSAHILAEHPQLAHIISQLVARNMTARPDASKLLNIISENIDKVSTMKELKQCILEKDSEIERLRAKLKAAGIKYDD